MNRFEALKTFCNAAETLHFKEAARRLSVSPQVVSRQIGELETALGEVLFQRNSRNVRLTPFGERFYIQAQSLLADSERLFAGGNEGEMAGIVRITLPVLVQNRQIVAEMLARAEAYPGLVLDWRMGEGRLNAVEERIDVGVRVGVVPDSRLTVKRICPMGAKVVATPELIAKLGAPKDLDDLQHNYPLSCLINVNDGRLWPWQFAGGVQFTPKNPHFIAATADSDVAAALSGKMFSHLANHIALPYIKSGELVSVLNEYCTCPWELFVYRTPQPFTAPRVKKVFEWLVAILQREYLG